MQNDALMERIAADLDSLDQRHAGTQVYDPRPIVTVIPGETT